MKLCRYNEGSSMKEIYFSFVKLFFEFQIKDMVDAHLKFIIGKEHKQTSRSGAFS